jgi:hypothetical protein
MVDVETKLALEADEPAVREVVDGHGASLLVDVEDPLVFWLTLSPPQAPEEEYVVRIAWEGGYPRAAPSVKFADGVGGRLDLSSAWPVIPGYRAGELDICQPFTAEAYRVHPEWAEGPEAWPATGNPFLWVVERLICDMVNRYQGRSG